MIKIDQNKKPISLFVVLVRSSRNRSIKSLSIVYLLGRSRSRHKNNAGMLRYALWTKVSTIFTAKRISIKPKNSMARSSPMIHEVIVDIHETTLVKMVVTVDRMVDNGGTGSSICTITGRLPTKNANMEFSPFYYIKRYA